MRCHACGQEHHLAAGERVGFRDGCPACSADLHACAGCAHYDPGGYNECREPGAERVLDKERANRCDWFAPGRGSDPAPDRVGALAELERLFKK